MNLSLDANAMQEGVIISIDKGEDENFLYSIKWNNGRFLSSYEEYEIQLIDHPAIAINGKIYNNQKEDYEELKKNFSI